MDYSIKKDKYIYFNIIYIRMDDTTINVLGLMILMCYIFGWFQLLLFVFT